MHATTNLEQSPTQMAEAFPETARLLNGDSQPTLCAAPQSIRKRIGKGIVDALSDDRAVSRVPSDLSARADVATVDQLTESPVFSEKALASQVVEHLQLAQIAALITSVQAP